MSKCGHFTCILSIFITFLLYYFLYLTHLYLKEEKFNKNMQYMILEKVFQKGVFGPSALDEGLADELLMTKTVENVAKISCTLYWSMHITGYKKMKVLQWLDHTSQVP